MVLSGTVPQTDPQSGAPKNRRTLVIVLVVVLLVALVVAALGTGIFSSSKPSFVQVSGDATASSGIPGYLTITVLGALPSTGFGGPETMCGYPNQPAPCNSGEEQIILVAPFTCPPCQRESTGPNDFSEGLPNGFDYSFQLQIVNSNGDYVSSCSPTTLDLSPAVSSSSMTFNVGC